MLSINLIGTGSVGKTIGRLLVKNKLATIRGVYNRNNESSVKGLKFIGEGQSCSSILDLPSADIVLITTPDDFIPEVSLALSQHQGMQSGCIVAHCSGSLTSDVLLSMKSRGCYVASIHPMRSFAEPDISVEQFAGTYCAIEGDDEAVDVVGNLFRSLDAIVYPLKKAKKAMYHAAGVFASNYLVTLSAQALSCMQLAEVDKEIAMKVIVNIMKGTVLNLEKTMSPEKSLTGPIQRGDISTLKNHLSAFESANLKKLYLLLGKATLDLTHHSEKNQAMLDELFEYTLR